MKPTNKTYQTFQELILKSEGKTLEDELGFGCRVIHKVNGEILKILGRKDTGEFSVRGEGGWYSTKDLDYLEILGKDIALERVLRALIKKITSKWFRSKKKEIQRECFDLLMFNAKWDLGHPAHLQEEETLLKLIEILS